MSALCGLSRLHLLQHGAEETACAVAAPPATVVPFRIHHNPDRARLAADLYA